MPTPLEPLQPTPLSRRTGLWLITLITISILVGDLLVSSRFSLGALYMIPFIIATQYVRRSSRLAVLGAVLIVLNFVAFLRPYVVTLGAMSPHFAPDHEFRYRLINRAFIAVALGGSAALIIGYIRVRDYWLRRHAQTAPTDEEVSFMLQVFQLFEDAIASIIALIIAAVIATLDFIKPQTMNLAILYVIPLALVAMTRSRWLLWIGAVVLLGMAFLGFHWGLQIPVSEETESRLLINREIACAALFLATVLFHLTSSPASRGKRTLASNAPLL